jgi:hypothetical protein
VPAFVTLARNTWTVTPLDPHRSRVSVRARPDLTSCTYPGCTTG